MVKNRRRYDRRRRIVAVAMIVIFLASTVFTAFYSFAAPRNSEVTPEDLAPLESTLVQTTNNSNTSSGTTGTVSSVSSLDVQATLSELSTLISDSRTRLDKIESISPSAAVQLNLDRIIIQDLLQKLDEEQDKQKKNGRDVDYSTEDVYVKGKEIVKECNSASVVKAYNESLKEFDILADGSKHKADFKTLLEITKVSNGTTVDAVKELETDMVAIIDLTKATGGAQVEGATQDTISDVLTDVTFTKAFINKYKDDMVNILNVTSPKYVKWMESNGHDMTKFKDEVNRWGTILSELCTVMGIIIDFSGDTFKDSNTGSAVNIGSELTPLIVEDGGKLTALGTELFGWSACLTPFQTNVNDFSNRDSLSEEAKQVFDEYSKYRTPVYSIIDNKNTIQGVRTGTSYELGNITLRDLIERVDKGDLVFYMSKLGEKEVNDLKVKSVNGNQTSFVNSSEDFIGPVYYASGNKNLDFSQKLDSPSMIKTGKSNPIVGKMTKSDLYMNYVTLYNHIKEGRYHMSSVQEDMDKALYFDFMGNVVTEGGYVVISAASNPVMYVEKGTPIITASWINGYPRTQVQGDSRLKLTEGDKDKFALGLKENIGINQYTLVQLNQTGNAFREQLNINKPLSIADEKDENAIEVLPTEGFMTVGKSYTISNSIKVFSNSSSSITYYDGDKVRKVNVASISTQGGDSSWNFIINQFSIMINSRENVNTPLLADITNIIPKCSQSGQLMLVNEVISSSGVDKFNAVNTFLGSLLEGLNNNLLNKMAQNGTFYNPMESASELGYEVKLIPVLISMIILVLLILLMKTILGVFRRDYVGIDILKSVLSLTLAAMFIIYGLEPSMDFMFNSVPNSFLKKEISMMSLYNIEDEYKEQDKRFFSSLVPEDMEFNSDITLEKIGSNEAKLIRESDGNAPELNFLYYLPEYDRRPYNLIGQSVFLQGRYMKVKIKDLFDMSAITDVVNADDVIELEHNEYEEAGYVAYYTPYFSFVDSIVYTLNAYSEGTNSGYKTLHYQKGLTKSTGRAADYFRSIFFLAPEMLDTYVNDSVEEYEDSLNKIEINDNSTRVEDKNTTVIGEEEEDPIKALLDPIDSNQDPVEEEDKSIDGKTTKYNTDLMEATDYMRDKLQDFDDWLGIKQRILYMNPQNDYDIEARGVIEGNKWFPQEAVLYETDPLMQQLVDEKIVTINENTKNFIITYLEPVATRISDENLVKIVSLYASMEFNKQFSVIGSQIYPKHINSIGMPNETVTKFQYFNSYLNFNNITSKISYVIAKESDWGGLLIALVDRIATIAKIVLKITLMSLIPMMPFIIAFLVTTRIGRDKRWLDKVLNTVGVLLMTYYLDMMAVKLSIWSVNKFGGMVGISVNCVMSIFILLAFYKLIKVVWFETPISFLSNIQGNIMRSFNKMRGTAERMIYGSSNLSGFNRNSYMSHNDIYNSMYQKGRGMYGNQQQSEPVYKSDTNHYNYYNAQQSGNRRPNQMGQSDYVRNDRSNVESGSAYRDNINNKYNNYKNKR